jgi:hypothetical protein
MIDEMNIRCNSQTTVNILLHILNCLFKLKYVQITSKGKKEQPMHIAPTCVGSEEKSNHFVSILCHPKNDLTILCHI